MRFCGLQVLILAAVEFQIQLSITIESGAPLRRTAPPSFSLSQQKKRINKRETKMNNMPRRHPQSYRGSLISESKLPKRDDVALASLYVILNDKALLGN